MILVCKSNHKFDHSYPTMAILTIQRGTHIMDSPRKRILFIRQLDKVWFGSVKQSAFSTGVPTASGVSASISSTFLCSSSSSSDPGPTIAITSFLAPLYIISLLPHTPKPRHQSSPPSTHWPCTAHQFTTKEDLTHWSTTIKQHISHLSTTKLVSTIIRWWTITID